MKTTIPFYGNTPDNTHCFQASLKMLLKYYFPDEDYSWEQLEKISAKVEGLWTWPMAGLLWIAEKGVEVNVVWKFDFDAFIANGGDYLIERYGKTVGEAQIIHSDLAQEQKITEEFVKHVSVDNRVANQKDIESLLDDGYLLICNIDLAVLNTVDDFLGHFVVIYGYDDDHF